MYQRLQQCLALVNRKRFCLNNNAHPYVAQPYSAETVRTWLRNLPHPAYLSDLSIDYHFFSITSYREKFSITKLLLKSPSENLLILELQNANGIKKLSHWQKYIDSNDSYFD